MIKESFSKGRERNLGNRSSDIFARLLQGVFGVVPSEVRDIVLSLRGANHQHLLELDFFLGLFNKLVVHTPDSLCGLLNNSFGLKRKGGGKKKSDRRVRERTRIRG